MGFTLATFHCLRPFSAAPTKDRPDEHHEDELISLYLSDAESCRLMQQSDSDVYAHVLSLARDIHPDISTESKPFYLVRRNEAIPVHEVGRYALADDFQKEQQANDGALRFCGDYLATATVEGAVTTGLTAVQ